MNRTTVDNMLPGRGAAAGTLNGSARQWGTEFGTMFLREPQLPKNNRKNNRVPFNWGTARRPRPRGASSRRLKHGRPHLSRRRKVPEDRGHGGGGRQGREPCRWRCGPWFGVVVAVLLLFFLPMHLGGFEGGCGCALLYLQREGGLRTRQGRCVKCGEKKRWWFYLSSAA